VPIQHGEYWLAIGVGFTSFEMINGLVLLTVQFGDDLAIAVLGVATLQLPTSLDNEEVYAFVELTLDAVLRPSEGTFSLTALLTSRSYLLDPACHLTGGFATCVWFPPNTFAGDFVITLGGYHPDFYCAHYPVIPRVGFSWAVSDVVSISGQLYFALTPRCVMAGGELSARFQQGNLAAWFDLRTDVIVYWRPFNFSADLFVSIGASYTAHWGLLNKTFTVELSADVTLEGPPFAGVAHIHWWVISFTVTINGGHAPTDVVLGSWSDFATASLPAPTTTSSGTVDNICRARVTSGLIAVTTDAAGNQTWHLSPDQLTISVETVIPITVGLKVSTATSATPVAVVIDAPSLNVAPLGRYPLESTLTVTMVPTSGPSCELSRGWTWTPAAVPTQAPAALWGPGNVAIDQSAPPVPSATDLNVPAVVAVVGAGTSTTVGNAVPIDQAACPPLPDRPLPFAATSSGTLVTRATITTADRVPTPSVGTAVMSQPAQPRLVAVARRATDHLDIRPDGRRVSGRWLVDASRSGGDVRGGPGTAYVYDTEGVAAPAVTAQGDTALSVTTVHGDEPLPTHVVVPAGGLLRVRGAPARLVATVLCDPGHESPAPGWDVRRSRLLRIDDHVFVGDGVVVTTQAPIRAPRRGRARAAVGGIDAEHVVAANRCRRAGASVPGWVATHFATGISSVEVTLDGTRQPPEVVVHDGGDRRRLVGRAHFRPGVPGATWWYPTPPQPDGVCVVVTPPSDGRLRRVVGTPAASDPSPGDVVAVGCVPLVVA
jgi:hypothetical protein